MAAELAASLERYRALVESTDAVPWEMDLATGCLRYLSPAAGRLFGFETESLVGKPFLTEMVEEDDRGRVERALAALHSGGTSAELEYRLVARDGGLRHVRTVVTRAGAGGEQSLRGITFDVTERKKLELELRQAQKLEAVGRLAAGVAHEINTPIQFIGDSIQSIEDGIKELTHLTERYRALLRRADGRDAHELLADAARAENEADLAYLLESLPAALDRSRDGVGRVATIVRSMKEFAHPDRKEMSAVDLNRAIQSTLVIARGEYKYVADVVTELGDLPLVTCHPGEINQAVLNIVVNAAHAIGDVVKGTGNRGRITVRTRQEGEAVVVSISDTGGGIPEAVQQRIFEPFFTTKEVGKGTGQGLAVARSVIRDKHGGDLHFESEPGVGTTFVIRLPIAGPALTPGEAA
jgi:PAS domain S-box-containing protein